MCWGGCRADTNSIASSLNVDNIVVKFSIGSEVQYGMSGQKERIS